MKALSIRQPWAWAILHAGKRVENREWTTAFRGRVLLHASKGCTREEYGEAAYFIEESCGIRDRLLALEDLPRGSLVGAATIVDCVPIEMDEWGRLTPNQRIAKPQERWACGPFGFVLDDVVALPKPIPCKGALGLWEVPEDVAARLRAMGRDHA